MRQYSSDLFEFTWMELDFAEGLASGTFMVEARSVASWSMKPTARGKVVRVFNPDRSGTLTFTVDQESTLHQQLLAISQADRDPAQRDQVDLGKMADTSSGAVTNYQNLFILTDPDESRGNESATFDWVFGFEAIEREPNETNADNLVGN